MRPLRKIVEVIEPAPSPDDHQLVWLDCGHQVRASAHAIYRARCRHCESREKEKE